MTLMADVNDGDTELLALMQNIRVVLVATVFQL
jgi:uncharacterized membrane protein AbrB (regulator of aidB expression)